MRAIFQVAVRGDAREESYYSDLKTLLVSVAQSLSRSKIHVTVLPKKTEAGNPDFRVWDGKKHIVGYIEAKPPGTNLDRVEDSEQLSRYLGTFPNVILTDFFEFRLYRNGAPVESVQIGRPFVATTLKKVPPVEKKEDFLELIKKFFSFSLPRVLTAKTLAVELARRTRFLRDEVVAEEIREEVEKGEGHLLGFYEAFHEHLIADLSHEQFADLYSQTITYGLFAARTRSDGDFSRKTAFDGIPHTIGILRDIFRYVSLEDLPDQMEWIVDDISEVLAVADINKILRRYFQKHKGSDPIIHFYETFLAEYDPKERELRGVYYTPEPVVSYICRSVHKVLKDVFGLADGLADTSVRLLDPAAGTLTFPAEAAKIAVEEAVGKYGEGVRAEIICEHIMRNFYAFELMMAPYAVGHLKIGFLLEELGHKLAADEQFQLYLTNTLDMRELAESKLPGMSSLARESHLALEVKRTTPILVIIGNPPYSGHSSNKGPWISQEIRAYYQVDGAPLGERNPKWLQDDYVKFIRFAQWKIDQAGEGVLAFITNHGYLENPTFRGMRQSLMQTFDQIHLLDLHGNSLKKEVCPDGSKDENVFDIRQGVAIAIFIKKKDIKKKTVHADLWGLRRRKNDWLIEHDIGNTGWQTIKPKSGGYLYVPRDEALLDRYESWPSLPDIFPTHSVGVVTARDHFVIDFDRDALERRIAMFRDENIPDDLIRQTFGLKDNRDWKMKTKRLAIIEDSGWKEKIIPILYRPFDTRWIFYHSDAIDFGRENVMKHLSLDNIAISTTRSIEIGRGFEHVLATTKIISHHTISMKEVNYLFPLYVYSIPGKEDFNFHHEEIEQKPNIRTFITNALTEALEAPLIPEELFRYLYAILYAPAYRTRYKDFLKSDFPRVPFTADVDLLLKIAELGGELCDLHLMRSPALDNPIARFEGEGNNKVDKQRYDEKTRRVYINKTQCFEGVPPEVWSYQIGGYQVMMKWLKDRKGRTLSFEDIRHYCRVATALARTIDLQAEIDELYQEVEKHTIEGLTGK